MQDDFCNPHSQIVKRFQESMPFKCRIMISTYCNQTCCNILLNGTYMRVASVASVACHQDGFNSVCTLPAGCIFDDTSLGDTKPLLLPCCPGVTLAPLPRIFQRCQLDLYDLDFAIDVTINPPSSRLSATGSTGPHRAPQGWGEITGSTMFNGFHPKNHRWVRLGPRLLDDRPGPRMAPHGPTVQM